MGTTSAHSDRTFDTVIRNGTVIDGSGVEPFVADVAIVDDRIAAIGGGLARGHDEIDATGMIVTPGFVDIHSHYDGQATWANQLSPSSAHGVTTVVMGNCGIGFAPCRPDDRASLIALMEGVEDIPEAVLAEGLPWNWESFPEYLDAIESRHYDMDVIAQLPHSALRVYVMGQRALDREAATAEDLEVMADLAREAIRAGAIGIATSRALIHRSADGSLIPSYDVAEDELHALAGALAAEQSGVIQAAFDGDEDKACENLELLERVADRSRRPVSFSLAQTLAYPDLWERMLERVADANSRGVQMKAQVFGRPIGMLLGLDLSFNPFTFRPSYQEIAELPLADRVREMRLPERRAAILNDPESTSGLPFLELISRFDWLFDLGNPPNYVPDPSNSVAAIAKRRGIEPQEIAYDLLLQDEGKAILLLPRANYSDGNLDAAKAMMDHPNTVLGLADGGAHCGVICDASLPTFMLSYWARDRQLQGGDGMSLAAAVRALTAEPAQAVGLCDRGLLAPGLKADINVINHEALRLGAPHMVADLPAGGRRLHQSALGYRATLVSGKLTRENDQSTGEFPGRLVRGTQPAPAAIN